MSDVSWNTRVLNSFIAAVEDQEDAMLTAMRDQTLLEPAGRDRLAALERQVISEWTSARLALSTVIPDWSARIKTGIFAGSERSQQKKLAQEAVALIERREDHLGREGETGPPTVSEDQLHPWVWSAARATWSSGHYRHAVSDAVEAVTTKLKERINFTGPSSAAYTAAFAESSPKAGNPRLHLRPFEEGNTWKNSQRGAAALGQACVAGLRNASVAHGVNDPVSRQEMLEQLAAVSLLARWVESAALVEHTEEP